MRAPRSMHVERTDDPAVMRWVCHDAALAASPHGVRCVPLDGPLGRLVVVGSVVAVTVRHGDVLVRAAQGTDWADLAPLVRDALAAELDALDASDDHWLLASDSAALELPTIADVQRIVDRAAGAITATHGGSMTVVAVDSTSVRLQAQGACDGCRQTDDTALGIIGPAVRAEYPELVDIVVEPAGSDVAGSAPTRWVRLGRR